MPRFTSKRTVEIGRRMLNFGRRIVKCTPKVLLSNIINLHVYWGGVGLPNTQCTNKRDSHYARTCVRQLSRAAGLALCVAERASSRGHRRDSHSSPRPTCLLSRSVFLRLGATSSFQPRPYSSSTPIPISSSLSAPPIATPALQLSQPSRPPSSSHTRASFALFFFF